MGQPIIQASHLRKVYVNDTVETVALSDISFGVEKGDFVAIMGPSGSGKSTLMHIIGALDKPTSGTYAIDGVEVGKLSENKLSQLRNKKIGFVFQFFNLLPRTTALKNVMLPMVYGGVSSQERVQKATEVLQLVGLGDRMDHTSSQLSGGQMQRVAIARALVMDPAIILADEPTGNISSVQAEEIMQIFEHLHKKGHTIVMITHEPDIAAHAQRIIELKDGKIVSDKRNGHRYGHK
ncbi:ABC transporter ATP-binding protein [Patescibacteria group bacterium]|nr:ABC transporter ATP-binding protein [Patescibacteria group bacterium]